MAEQTDPNKDRILFAIGSARLMDGTCVPVEFWCDKSELAGFGYFQLKKDEEAQSDQRHRDVDGHEQEEY